VDLFTHEECASVAEVHAGSVAQRPKLSKRKNPHVICFYRGRKRREHDRRKKRDCAPIWYGREGTKEEEKREELFACSWEKGRVAPSRPSRQKEGTTKNLMKKFRRGTSRAAKEETSLRRARFT